MLPEVLRSGQHVMLSAEPKGLALVPLEKAGTNSLHVDVVFRCSMARLAETARYRACWNWPGCRLLARACAGALRRRRAWIRTLPEALSAGGPAGGRFHRHSLDHVGAIARKGASAGAQEVPLPSVRETGGAGLFGGHGRKRTAPRNCRRRSTLPLNSRRKSSSRKFVNGREIELSVLGNETPEASIPREIIPHRR